MDALGWCGMYSAIPTERLNNLRYSLCVMEEQSHMGLDDEAAGKLKSILERRIERMERDLPIASPGG